VLLSSDQLPVTPSVPGDRVAMLPVAYPSAVGAVPTRKSSAISVAAGAAAARPRVAAAAAR